MAELDLQRAAPSAEKGTEAHLHLRFLKTPFCDKLSEFFMFQFLEKKKNLFLSISIRRVMRTLRPLS